MDAVKNTTCFREHNLSGKSCRKKSCKYWCKSKDNMNCILIASKKSNLTLQDIGDMFGLTRMRICQIEKIALEKIKSLIL